MNQKIYFIDWTKKLDEFLTAKGYFFIVSEADIIGLKLYGHNDTVFVNLMLDYSRWIIDNANDMSINPFGNGLFYHSN